MYYAIGDIHGEISLLKKLYNEILEHVEQNDDQFNEIIFLGDYIDRGENSKAVLDFLMAIENTTILKHVFLMGNHEDLFVSAISRPMQDMSLWTRNGGNTTLRDFKTTIKYSDKSIFRPYIDWINQNCINYHETFDYVFCHGGLDTRTQLDETEEDIFWWKRTMHLGEYADYNKLVVHGHTPQTNGVPLYGQNELNIDTHVVYTKKLTCAVLPEIYEDTMTYWLGIEFLVT